MVKKISIIGCGAVGSTFAFHLLSRIDLKELILVDTAGTLARGVALDLEDTRKFLGFSTEVVGTKSIARIKNSEIVVITAGVARKEGMTRLDLLKINGNIARQVSQSIRKLAPFSIVVVVTNPLDLITYIVVKETRFARERVMGMGSSLDTSRLFNIIYRRTGISTSSMDGYVFGPHSKDMIVSAQRVKIKGEPVDRFVSPQEWEKVKDEVKMRGAEIVKFLKNRSAQFAPSLSCAYLVESIVRGRNEIIPVSVLLKGEYGLKDICVGLPCVINRKGIEKVITPPLTSDEMNELKKLEDLFRNV